ncbi:5-formyltetrahydrofolate cyclo-ligase [Buchnera aphidicola (Melanaphis sacchari)]|uniref:5-formyltetrahydrofolate cyclo-ligase n=1 Tax=Buchnera aphidicola (Melanaphis sacchari) TaxID=2173854 RepID=A0A2U8DFA8_9GAMM|nr:5-formyltetrahydrofolate cyclo-ligase [Buchnera aphidicola]AWH90387.1 5-formyltetrahydrofolate cyclo-ligase [Buchnera aphidicola (Melanaphis sacchari)]
MKKILQSRKKIRSDIRILRRSLSFFEKINAANKIVQTSWDFKIFHIAKNIGCFLSFDSEIDTYPLIKKLWLNKKNVFVPVIRSFSKKKIFFVPFTSQSILHPNKYNILEPYFDDKDIISELYLDIVIVPLVGFDLKGFRLGMGGGFYDNFLRNWKLKKIIPIGYAYDFQLIKSYMIEESWDISLPIVLTPKKIYFFSKF